MNTPTTDHRERARVKSRIEALIREFCRLNPTFHMEDLTLYVQARIKVAPDSPGRILRHLRQRGLKVELVSRRGSLYRVGERPAEQIQMFQAEAS